MRYTNRRILYITLLSFLISDIEIFAAVKGFVVRQRLKAGRSNVVTR